MFGFGFRYGFKSGLISSIGKKLAKAYKTRVEADGGTYENNACLVAALDNLNAISSPSLLLDIYRDAAAAYSLESIKESTTNVIKARRSSDDAELDFTAEQITDGTLTTWTGAGDGFVTIWYDQSGNNKNISSSIAAQQPQVVSSGSVLMDNGSPYILYDGNSTSGLLNTSSGLSSSSGSVFATYNSNDTGNGMIFSNQSGNVYMGAIENGSNVAANNSVSGTISYFENGSLIGSTRNNLYDNYVKNNDVLVTMLNTNFSSSDWSSFTPYVYAVNSFSQIVKAKEFIIYNFDQTGNKAGIESDINSRYTIY